MSLIRHGVGRLRCGNRYQARAGTVQMLDTCPKHVERAQEVNINHRLKRIGRHARSRSQKIPGLPGQHHINLAIERDAFLRRFGNFVIIAHIHRGAIGLCPKRPQFFHRGTDLVLRARNHKQIGPGHGKAAGDLLIDP